MANPGITRAVYDRTVAMIEQCLADGFHPLRSMGGRGSAIEEAERRLGGSNFYTRLTSGAKKGWPPPDWSLYVPPELAQAPASRAAEDLLKEERAARRTAEDRLRDATEKLSVIQGVKTSIVPALNWKARKPEIGKATVLTPLLFTSDFQCGEVIKPDEVDGLNRYDKDVFAERYRVLIERSIGLANTHVGNAAFPGIVYMRGGDAISGEIHEELARTNDLSSCPAVAWLVRHEAEGIRQLKAKFGKVRVISIPGNHGRTTLRPQSKGYVDFNYESMIAWWLETLFADDPAVTFFIPRSGDAYFDVEGWKVLASHGDRMGSRGGMGFVGPAATIARGHKKLYDNWTMTGRRVDLILTGHLHTSLKLELGYGNGALAGYGEYARDIRATPDAAKQWLLFFHEREKISHQFEVRLSEFPRRIVQEAA